MDTNVYHWYHGKLNVGHQTCRHPRPLGEFGKHRTCDFKLQSKMATVTRTERVDFRRFDNKSVNNLIRFTINPSQYVHYD